VRDPLEEATADVDRRSATYVLIAAVVGLVALGALNPGARDVLLVILGIILLIMLHEAGHYFAAKRAGMKVTEFFVGFGPRLWSFQRGETEYGIKAILLGGYVRILGFTSLEQPEQDPDTGEWHHDFRPEDEPRTFRRGSFKNRMVVVLAGVTVNVLIAFLCFFVFIAGQGKVVEGPTTTIAEVVAKSAAAEAGFEQGDRIVAVSGERVRGWEQLKRAIERSGGEPTVFVVERDGERVTLEATPKQRKGEGFLGVAPRTGFRDVGVLEAVPETFSFMGDVVVGTGEAVGRVFSPSGVERIGKNLTSDLPAQGSRESLERPRGIIGIVDYGSSIIDGNLWTLVLLLGNISLVLALFNLLPLLPLDGGHAAVVGYEWIASKIRKREVRVDYRKLMPATAVVFFILLTIGLSVMVVDIRDAVGS
jgi:membrane-associated protease RseP (regulator of RpoE activity)